MMILPGNVQDYAANANNGLAAVHLGCGSMRMEGWLNCDYINGGVADVLFDVQERWPLKENSVAMVYASHMLEHLPYPIDFFREMHRVVVQGGEICLRLPYGATDAAMADLTHMRPWYAESFLSLQPGYGRSIGNPQHDDWPYPYGIQKIILKLSRRFRLWIRLPLIRRAFMQVIHHLQNVIDEIFVYMFPLKTPEAIESFLKDHSPRAAYVEYGMMSNDYYGQPFVRGEPRELIPLVAVVRGVG